MTRSQPADPATLRFYAASAATYTSTNKAKRRERLHAFLKLLPPGGRVLELGCGGGWDAEAILAAGFDLDPTDGTPEIAAQAKQKLGRTVRVMRFDELATANEYDGVLAQASLLHVPRPALPDILGRIHNALKPDGHHFASFKAGGQEGRDEHGRYFNYFSHDELEAVYRAAAPWSIVSLEQHIGGGFSGKQGPWLAITVRKVG